MSETARPPKVTVMRAGPQKTFVSGYCVCLMVMQRMIGPLMMGISVPFNGSWWKRPLCLKLSKTFKLHLDKTLWPELWSKQDGLDASSCCSHTLLLISLHVCSRSISVFNRCVPADVVCYAEFAQDLVTFVSDNNVFRRVIAGVVASKGVILGLCLLALGTTHFCLLPVASASRLRTCVFVCHCVYVFLTKILLVFMSRGKTCAWERPCENYRVTGNAWGIFCFCLWKTPSLSAQ